MKKALAGVLAAGVFLAGAGTAFASSWKEANPIEVDRKVVLKDIEYRFNPAHHNHGAFEWRGALKDLDPGDGRNGYVRIRVENRGWVHYYGKQRSTVRMHHSNWEGSQLYTDDADISVCLDRGALRWDDCTNGVHFSTHR
ncbi:hypothetical protein [Streptomyces sp. NPDC127190]|uniref:hypothetical protein n=1 Tax=unclassified Streptomyces TaxID=2593676 RepID=UPI00363366A0